MFQRLAEAIYTQDDNLEILRIFTYLFLVDIRFAQSEFFEPYVRITRVLIKSIFLNSSYKKNDEQLSLFLLKSIPYASYAQWGVSSIAFNAIDLGGAL